MKRYYYRDDLSIWDRKFNNVIARAIHLEDALLIVDALNNGEEK